MSHIANCLIVLPAHEAQLRQRLYDIADDDGTQPAYRRGMYRAIDAYRAFLIDGTPPVEAVREVRS